MTAAGGVSYGYDARGNQTSRGSDSFQWDHENRMTELTIGSTTASYAYNGDGMRMNSTVGSTTTNYVWDVAAGLPVILQDGTNTYVYGLGLISTYDGTNMTYRLTDALGSTVALCDGSGNVLDTYTYDAFGGIRAQTGSSANPFKFTGEQRDSESGYDFLRARYYDPVVGRFLSQDPLGGGYPYGLNNPVSMIDRFGLCAYYAETPEGMPVCADDPVIGLPADYYGLGQPEIPPAQVIVEAYIENITGGAYSQPSTDAGPVLRPDPVPPTAEPEGYVETSGTGCFIVCANIGIQYTGLDDIHIKVGVGVGSPGANVSTEVYRRQSITTGDYCGADFSVGGPIGVQAAKGESYSYNYDPGKGLVTTRSAYETFTGSYVGTPGGSLTCGSVSGDITPW